MHFIDWSSASIECLCKSRSFASLQVWRIQMRVIVMMTRKDISSDFRESDAAACQRGVTRSFPNKALKTDNLSQESHSKVRPCTTWNIKVHNSIVRKRLNKYGCLEDLPGENNICGKVISAHSSVLWTDETRVEKVLSASHWWRLKYDIPLHTSPNPVWCCLLQTLRQLWIN